MDALSNDFLLAFFVDQKVTFHFLSEVVKKRDDPLFVESLNLSGDFVLPFSQKEVSSALVYVFSQEQDSEYNETIYEHTGSLVQDEVIQNGDYFTFQVGEKTVKALFMQVSDIRLGYTKYIINKGTNIFIGRTPDNDVFCDFTDYLSREKHAAIRIDDNGEAYIEDLKRSVGVYVNGLQTHSQKLEMFDEIFIMGLSIIYMKDFIAVRNIASGSRLNPFTMMQSKIPLKEIKAEECFVSTPRILKSLDNDEIEIDPPPNPPSIDDTPTILVIGPSITMAMVMLASVGMTVFNAIRGGNTMMLVVGITMAVGMLAGSLLWPNLLRRYQKKKVKKEEAFRVEKYSAYIDNIDQVLQTKTDRAKRILEEYLSPSPDRLCALLDSDENRLHLWERSPEDKDFLHTRLGLGERGFDVRIKTPKRRFQLHEDEMMALPDSLLDKYSVLTNVPVTLDIEHNRTIGVIGTSGNIRKIVGEMILNVISLHSPDDVKIIMAVSPKQLREYEVFKNIPHIWSNDKKIRYFATTPDEVHYVFNTIDDLLKEKEMAEDTMDYPRYVFIITDPTLVKKEALLRYMSDSNNTVGIATVFAYGDITKLPRSCKTIIQSDNQTTGFYIKNMNANRFIQFKLDEWNQSKVYAFVDKLSKLPVQRDSRSLGIVDSISFLQMYRAGNVAELHIEEHWDNNNSAKSLAAPIGVMAGGEVFNLDLHESYHGCHGLIAGTTGSGKSEFLQALVLSLAVNYSPKEIAFVLIDFKGGDMARPFMKKAFSPALPHLAATVSNMSGNMLYRSLVSLDAEIKYRQRLFNEAAKELEVDKLNINSYHKYYKNGKLRTPLPHLVIIIDEFAQLKTQQPDFLTQLINVAQVGRSLGIHLILATQKPSGIVDPQIMSNSRFKVCLKVAEKQDSTDMLGKADAVMLKNPGRLYLQVGYDEVYECMQSGYSGADYMPTETYMPDEDIMVSMIDNTANINHSAKLDLTISKSDKTQLEAVVAELVALGQKKNLTAKPLWMDVLPEKVILGELSKSNKGLATATIGLLDLVRIQEQKPFTIDLTKTGHIALYGAGGTGKTTFLQTLVYSMVCAYQYTPDELNIYAMDFGGRNLSYLERLPHTGGVVFAGEDDKVYHFIDLLQELIDERKSLFSALNCSTYIDYKAASNKPLPASNKPLPIVLILIDNYASFRDKYMDAAENLVELIELGRAFGVYFVITGSTKNAIHYKVVEHISYFLSLKMNDPNSYYDIFNGRPQIMPEDINGRGILMIEKDAVEFQTALALPSDTEVERISTICEQYDAIAQAWTGTIPVQIADGEWAGAEEDILPSYGISPAVKEIKIPEAITDEDNALVFGESMSGVLQYGMTLTDEYKACLLLNDLLIAVGFYEYLIDAIMARKGQRVVVIDLGEIMCESTVATADSCQYLTTIESLNDFIELLKPELNARLENAESCQEQLFLIITEFNQFFEAITDEQAAFMRKVMKYMNTPQYGIYFICGFDVNGNKNNDALFLDLIVNAESYVSIRGGYNIAIKKIEGLVTIDKMSERSNYFCKLGKSVEIRW